MNDKTIRVGMARQAKWLKVRAKLLELASIEDNWDGLGATAVNTDIINNASYLFMALQESGLEPPIRLTASRLS